MARSDARPLDDADYAEVPELTDADFARGVVHENGRPILRGRQRSASPKRSVTLRLDATTLERYRALGPGWQTVMNEDLRAAAENRLADGTRP